MLYYTKVYKTLKTFVHIIKTHGLVSAAKHDVKHTFCLATGIANFKFLQLYLYNYRATVYTKLICTIFSYTFMSSTCVALEEK